MRIAIVGSGGVGGYFGGRLALAGNDVTFIARGEHLRALRSTGLRVDSINGDFTVSPVRATDDPTQVNNVDVVILGVKAWQIGEAAHAIVPMIGASTFVLPLQNGVEAFEQLAAVLGKNTCSADCVRSSVTLSSRGIFDMPASSPLWLSVSGTITQV